MIFVLIILLLLIFNNSKIYGTNSFNKDYMSKSSTTAINGLFVIIVILRHYSEYVSWQGVLDQPFVTFNYLLSQLLVVTFLFYSGYGMMEQLRKKGFDYVKKIPSKWIELFVKFDIAVLLYLILGLLLGKVFTVSQVFLSFLGWESLGNSNWYIFVILSLYILMFISFYILKFKNSDFNKYLSTFILFIFSVLLVYVLMKSGKASHWYNTLFIFPIGVLYSLIKDRINKFVMKNDINYLLALSITTGLFFLSFIFRFRYGIESYTVWVISFMALILLITMKINIKNELLVWLGSHVFSIYILQRLIMMILNYFGYTQNHRYICLIVVFVGTCFIAAIFDKYTDKIFCRGKKI